MPDQASRKGRAKLWAGLVIAAFEFASDCLHPEITEILLVAGVAIPVIMMTALLVTIARSDAQTCERIFRLLRWMVNRPEPPGTQAMAAGLVSTVIPGYLKGGPAVTHCAQQCPGALRG